MSRSQQTQVLNTANADTAADQTTATTAQAAEAGDIGDYQAQLAKFASSNPFTEGGEFQTDANKDLSGVADVGSQTIQNQENTTAQRTGQNAGTGDAIAAEAARANQRDLATQEGSADAQRIGDEAGYNQTTLNATATPAQLEAGIANPSLSAAGQTLGTAAGVAATPGFWDTLGDSFAGGLGKLASGDASSESGSGAAAIMAAGCWVAAELYGGWFEPRTVDVRRWLFEDFGSRWYGAPVCWLYLHCGENLASCIRRWPILRRFFLPLFNFALRKARGL